MKTDENGIGVCAEVAAFDRFSIELPPQAVEACSHQGACDEDVAYWAPRIPRPTEITPDKLRAELKEYGAWDAEELADDAENWHKIIWLAAGNIKEDRRENEKGRS